MKWRDGATIEWRALWETVVIPVPSVRAMRNAAEREAISASYPFELTGCRIERAATIGAVVVTPPGLSLAAADRPVPALAIARSPRVRRSLDAGDAVYRFGTSRGYDYYRFRRRRLVACWSTVNGESDLDASPTPALRFPPRALTAGRAGHLNSDTRRARVVTVALAVAAFGVQLLPPSSGEDSAGTDSVPTHAVSGTAISGPPRDNATSGSPASHRASPLSVLSTAGRLFPDLQIRSFSAGRDHYRWELQTSRGLVEVAPLAETYPEIIISVQRRDNHTTVSLEGKK